MDQTLLQSRSRSAFRAAAASLLALISLTAFVAGCGGAKEDAPAPSVITETPAPATSDPVATLDPAADAKAQFASKCATCHGASGHGDGAASAVLNPKPRNFHDTAYMSTRTDADLGKVITEGKGVMPKWGGLLTEGQIVALVAHIRELGKAH